MAAGEVFIVQETSAETNVSNTTEATETYGATPEVQQGDWSGEWNGTTEQLNCPSANTDLPILIGHHKMVRASGTQRSQSTDQIRINGVNQRPGASTDYVRLSGGADESSRSGAGFFEIGTADHKIEIRRGCTLDATDRVGDYDRTSGDPKGLWAVVFPDNDRLYLSYNANDGHNGVYNNTPRPIDLQPMSALSSGSWDYVNWSQDSKSGTTFGFTGPSDNWTLAANSQALLVATFLCDSTGTDRNSILIRIEETDGTGAWGGCFSKYLRQSANEPHYRSVMIPLVNDTGSTKTYRVGYVSQVEESGGHECQITEGTLQLIDVTGQDMTIASHDTRRTYLRNAYTTHAFNGTLFEQGTALDHDDATNNTRITNNSGGEITVLAGHSVFWDRSASSDSSRKNPFSQLSRNGTVLDHAVDGAYNRGAQSGDDQFISGYGFGCPVVLTTGQYLETGTFDYATNADETMVIANDLAEGVAEIFWAIRIDDIGGAADPKEVTPGVGSITATGYAPTVDVSDNKEVTPPVGSVTITGYAPTPTAGDNKEVTPPVGSVTATGYAPTVALSDNQEATPGVGAATLAGYAPTITVVEPHRFQMAASGNIAASGENTTFQLAAPSGKSTGDFGGGRIQDDENPGDAVDLAADEYREDEWCIEATADAENGATYQFRVVLGDTELSTYTVDPRWTIGDPQEATPPAGSLIITGYAPIPDVSRDAKPGVGSAVIAGYAPTVDVSRSALPGVGSVEITGQAPTVDVSRDAKPGVGSVTITGQVPTVTTADHKDVTVPVGSVVATGQAPTPDISRDAKPGAGSATFTGFAPSVSAGVGAIVPVGSLIIAGQAPTPTLTDHQDVEVPVGSLTVTGQTPTPDVSRDAKPGAGSATFTGFAPTVDAGGNVSVEPGVGSVAITGNVPTADISRDAKPGVGSLTVTGLAPTVDVGANVEAEPGVGSVTITGQVPTPSATENVAVTVPVGSLTIAGQAPTVVVTDHKNVEVPVGATLLTGFAPTVTATDHKTVTVGVGSLTFTGQAPTVDIATLLSADVFAVAAYVDRAWSVTAYVERDRSEVAYIDRARSYTAYIERDRPLTVYIDQALGLEVER